MKHGVYLIHSGIAVVVGALLVAWFFGPGKFTIAFATSGATLFGVGIGKWLRSGMESERAAKRRTLIKRTAAAGIGGIALLGLCFGAYVAVYRTTDNACRHAMSIESLEQREVGLQYIVSRWVWLEWLFKKRVTDGWCYRGINEIQAFREEGICPSIVPDGISCQCEQDRWPTDLGCIGPVTCWYEGEIPHRTMRLRCLAQSQLEEFGFEIKPGAQIRH